MQVELFEIFQVLTPVILAVVGWGVRLVWGEIRSLRAEMREYVRQETCRVHRENIQHQLNSLRRGE